MKAKESNKDALLTINDKLAWVYVMLASFILYVYTLTPGITWGDSAKLVNYVIKKKITSDLVGGHNLHTILGLIFNLLPLHDVAYKQNLMSAFFAALALGIFYIVSEKIIKSKIAALAATISLAVSQMFWFMSVVNESYSLIYCFFAILLFLMVKYRENHKSISLFLFTLLYALSVFENMLLAVFLPAYLFFFLSTDKKIIKDKLNLAVIITGILIGFVLPLWLLRIYTASHVFTTHPFIESIILGVIDSAKTYFRSLHHIVRQLILYPAYLFYQFPVWGFIIGIVGLYKSYRTDKLLFYSLIIIIILNVFFASMYMLQRAFNLMVPGFMIFAIFIGYGVKWLFEDRMFIRGNIVKVVMLILIFFTPILFYGTVSTYILHHPNKMLVHARELPYRNNIEYYLIPWKQNNYGPELYAYQIFSVLPKNAILIADFTPEEVLRYYQLAYNFRKDVNIVDEDHYVFMGKDGGNALVNYIASELKNGKAVFLADDNPQYYFIPDLTKVFDIQKFGLAYKVSFK